MNFLDHLPYRRIGIGTGLVALALLGEWLYGNPIPVDAPGSHIRDGGAFLLFLTFWLSLVLTGRGIAQIFDVHRNSGRLLPAVTLGMGSWFYALLALVLSALAPQLFHHRLSTMGLTLAPALTSVLLLPPEALQLPLKRTKKNHVTFSNLGWLLVATLVLLRLLEGWHIFTHGDAYIVYLTAPRVVYENLGYQRFLDWPILFFSGLWEGLYLWGNAWLGAKGGLGLDAGQRFAQWMTAGVGVLGIAATLRALLSRLAKLAQLEHPPVLTGFAVLAALSVPDLRWMENLAKNDIGVCFWALLGVALMLENRALWGGAFLGMATATKPSIAFLPLWTCIIASLLQAQLRQRILTLNWSGWGGILGALPIWIRNHTLTGNPFFPFFQNLYPPSSWNPPIGPSMLRGLTQATASVGGGASFSIESQITYLLEVVLHQPWNAMSIVAATGMSWSFVRYGKAKKTTPALALIAISWLSVLTFNLFLRPNAEFRYQAPTLLLISALGICGTEFFFGEFFERFISQMHKKILYASVGFLIVVLSGMPLFRLVQIGTKKMRTADHQVLEHLGGAAKRWMRQQVRAGEKVASFGDNQAYYAAHVGFAPVDYLTSLDQSLARAQTPREAFRSLQTLGYTYAYVSHHRWSIYYSNYHPPILQELKRFSQCISFADSESTIYRMSCVVSQK